jgi:hypothetical protein
MGLNYYYSDEYYNKCNMTQTIDITNNNNLTHMYDAKTFLNDSLTSYNNSFNYNLNDIQTCKFDKTFYQKTLTEEVRGLY